MKLTAETDSQAKAETSFFLDQFFRLRLATKRSADVKLLVRRISHLDGLFFIVSFCYNDEFFQMQKSLDL